MRSYYVPVHRSLTTPVLLGGVKHPVAIAIAMVAIFGMLAGLGLKILVPMTLLHLGLRELTRRDPEYLRTLAVHMQQRDELLP